MKRRRGRHEATVELTPLIDVVFLLLIFFMVSTTFVRESELTIELPEADGEPVEANVEQRSIEIIVDRSGEYSVNQRLLVNSTKRTLVRALQETLEDEELKAQINSGAGLPPVVIRADAKADHEAVVRAMDAAGTVGLVKVSISTRQSSEEQ